MKKLTRILLFTCLIFTFIVPISHAYEQLVIQGSTTVLPIAQAAAEIFMQDNPQVDISVRGGGSGNGIAALLDETCDIADSSRSIKVNEVILAQKTGISAVGNIVAMDGIAIVVHPSNSVNAIKMEQIKDIYTGKIKNWKELGGEDKKIIVVGRDSSSGTFEAFESIVMKGAKVIPEALAQVSNKTVATIVSTTEGAIGYVGLGYLSDAIKALEVNGIIANSDNVGNGKYHISRPLYMYTDGAPEGTMKQFIEFIWSEKGQKIVAEQGFVVLK